MSSTPRAPRKQVIERAYGPLRLLLLRYTYEEHLSQVQIAERLGVPEGTISSWFWREGIQSTQLARLKARELLKSRAKPKPVQVTKGRS